MTPRLPHDLPKKTLGDNQHVLLVDLVDSETELVLLHNPDGNPYTDQAEGIESDIQRQRINPLPIALEPFKEKIKTFYRQRILTASRCSVEDHLLTLYSVMPITDRSAGSTQASHGTTDSAVFSMDEKENIVFTVTSKEFAVSDLENPEKAKTVIPGEVTSVFLLTDRGFKFQHMIASNTLLDDVIMEKKSNVPFNTIAEYANLEETISMQGIQLSLITNGEESKAETIKIKKTDFLILLKQLREEVNPRITVLFFIDFCQKHNVTQDYKSDLVRKMRECQPAEFNASLVCKTNDSFTPQQVILNYIEHHSLEELTYFSMSEIEIAPEESNDEEIKKKAVAYAKRIASYLCKIGGFSVAIEKLIKKCAGQPWVDQQINLLLGYLEQDPTQTKKIIDHSRLFYLSDALTVHNIYYRAFQEDCFTEKMLSEKALDFLLYPRKIEETLEIYEKLENKHEHADEERRIQVLKASYESNVAIQSSTHQNSGRIIEGHIFDKIYAHTLQQQYFDKILKEKQYVTARDCLLVMLDFAITDAKKMAPSIDEPPIKFCLVASLATPFLKIPEEAEKQIGDATHPFFILLQRLIHKITETIQDNLPVNTIMDLENFEKISFKIFREAENAMKNMALDYYQYYFEHVGQHKNEFANILFNEIKQNSLPVFTKKIVCDRIKFLFDNGSFNLDEEAFYWFGRLSPSTDTQYHFWTNEKKFKHADYLKKVLEFLDELNKALSPHGTLSANDMKIIRTTIAHVLLDAYQEAEPKAHQSDSQVFFNYLNTVIGEEPDIDQDTRLDIIEKINDYLILEIEFSAENATMLMKEIKSLKTFSRNYEQSVRNQSATMLSLPNLIKAEKKQHKKNVIVSKIFEKIDHHFNDIKKNSKKYIIAIVDTFFNLCELHQRINFVNLIIQIPKWLQNANPGSQFSSENKARIRGIFNSIFSLENVNYNVVFFELKTVLGEINIQEDEFISLVTYMADYLYNKISEKMASFIMSTFVENFLSNISEDATTRFFFARLVSPNDTENYFQKKLVTRQCNDFYPFLERYNNKIKNAENDESFREWAKKVITKKSDDVRLDIAVMQSIFLDASKKRTLDQEEIYILALSCLKQRPRNIYMACKFFRYFLSSTVSADQQEEIVEILSLLQGDGFFCPRNALENLGDNTVQIVREKIVSKSLEVELQILSQTIRDEKTETIISYPSTTRIMKEVDKYIDIISLKQISENNDFSFFKSLWDRKQKDNPSKGFYLFICKEKIDYFPAMKKEIENNPDNKYGLYAMVIAYLITEKKDFNTELFAFESETARPNIPLFWCRFLGAYSRENVSRSLLFLVMLESEYQKLDIPQVGQKAIALLKKAIVPEKFRQYLKEYLFLACMFTDLTEHTASAMMEFLINKNQNPFIFYTQHVSCLILYKEQLGFFQYFYFFLTYFYSITPADNHSILVLLLEKTEKNVGFIKKINIFGQSSPDLFSFFWYLKQDEKQTELATALIPYVNNAQDLRCFFTFFSQDSNIEHNFECEKNQILQMINKENGLSTLINRTEEHLRLAFIVHQQLDTSKSVCKKYLPYFILQKPEALATLFFISELSTEANDERVLFAMNFLILHCKPLTLHLLLSSIRSFSFFSGIKEEIKTVIENIAEKEADEQIVSTLGFFENKEQAACHQLKIV